MSLHIVRIEQGNVTAPAQANQNPSVAQSPTQAVGQSPIGVTIKAAAFIQAGKQITNGVIGNIGFATGDYVLQEKIETFTEIAGIGVGLAAAPLATASALAIKTGFEIYQTQVTQQRKIFKQQQQQVLTGKIAVNGGVWL